MCARAASGYVRDVMVVTCEVQHCGDVGKCGCCTEGVTVHTEGACGSGRTTPLIPNLCTRRRLGDPKPQPVAQSLDTKAVYKTAVLTSGFGTTS